jgi:hypothetical protein
MAMLIRFDGADEPKTEEGTKVGTINAPAEPATAVLIKFRRVVSIK